MERKFKGVYYFNYDENVFYGYIPGVSVFENGEDNECLTFADSEEEIKELVEDALSLELYRFTSVDSALINNQKRCELLNEINDLHLFDIDFEF